MKYILVTGGVISGVGKGVVASSLGVILQAQGLHVSAIKIDPYINPDAGTFSPYEHGEVYVLEDGAEVDLDLGNYERFLNLKLHRDNNFTTGKIYLNVINEERKGSYLGKTVQVVPHISSAIQDWVRRVAVVPVDGTDITPDVCIIELGGTVGDIEVMPFAEAFSHFSVNKLKGKDFLNVHVSYVLQPKSTGEQKTKPTQASVRELRRLGLSPDLIVCRCDNVISNVTKNKISNWCHVSFEQVIGVHDVSSIYQVPLLLAKQKVWSFIAEKLELPLTSSQANLTDWKLLIDKMEHATKEVRIVIVGKYVIMKDAYTSVIEALKHAAFHCNYRLDLQFVDSSNLEPATKIADPETYAKVWKVLRSADGVLVPGGFGDRGIEGKILTCEWCRKNDVPLLGICLGMQCAVIEFARNVLNFQDANSEEFDKKTKYPVVIEMPEHHTGKMGGTMRLGLRRTYFKTTQSKLKSLYEPRVEDGSGKEYVEERHRHRYEINPDFVARFEESGLRFVATDSELKRMEICELEGHVYFVGVQYHPEYVSRPLKASPPYMGLIEAAGKYSGEMVKVNGEEYVNINNGSGDVVNNHNSRYH